MEVREYTKKMPPRMTAARGATRVWAWGLAGEESRRGDGWQGVDVRGSLEGNHGDGEWCAE